MDVCRRRSYIRSPDWGASSHHHDGATVGPRLFDLSKVPATAAHESSVRELLFRLDTGC